MQSGDELKIINAARYLQHLCYSKESVTKDKVKFLVENATSPFYFIQPLGLGSLLVLFPIKLKILKKTRQKRQNDDSGEKSRANIYSGKRLTLRKQLPYGLK